MAHSILKMKQIFLYYCREKKQFEKEIVFEEEKLRFLYYTLVGKICARVLILRPVFSAIYGYRMHLSKSKQKIPDFIARYSINTDDCEKPVESYQNFNEFFIRKLKVGARPIDNQADSLIAPADSRLSAYTIDPSGTIQIKGRSFLMRNLMRNDAMIEYYMQGTCLVFRLAPADYHRFCYIDDGMHEEIQKVGGLLHSVHPIALQKIYDIFLQNYREYTQLKTDTFSDVLEIDIGALLVGKIKQHFPNGTTFKRGEEKGYFEFGGSTIILLFKKNCIQLDDDIAKFIQDGYEVKVAMGSRIGKRCKECRE